MSVVQSAVYWYYYDCYDFKWKEKVKITRSFIIFPQVLLVCCKISMVCYSNIKSIHFALSLISCVLMHKSQLLCFDVLINKVWIRPILPKWQRCFKKKMKLKIKVGVEKFKISTLNRLLLLLLFPLAVLPNKRA
jgi:hypothetical protein